MVRCELNVGLEVNAGQNHQSAAEKLAIIKVTIINLNIVFTKL
jgi:hypothetical protein